MLRKFFTIFLSNRLDPRSEWFESLNNSVTELIKRFTIYLTHHCITAFSFNKCDDGMLMPCPNDGATFSMINMQASLNRLRSFAYSASIKG